jgi:hypothetical protein
LEQHLFRHLHYLETKQLRQAKLFQLKLPKQRDFQILIFLQKDEALWRLALLGALLKWPVCLIPELVAR